MEKIKEIYQKYKTIILGFFAGIFSAIYVFWIINIRKKEIVAIDDEDNIFTREMLEQKNLEILEYKKEELAREEEKREKELIEDTEKIDSILRVKYGLKKHEEENV